MAALDASPVRTCEICSNILGASLKCGDCGFDSARSTSSPDWRTAYLAATIVRDNWITSSANNGNPEISEFSHLWKNFSDCVARFYSLKDALNKGERFIPKYELSLTKSTWAVISSLQSSAEGLLSQLNTTHWVGCYHVFESTLNSAQALQLSVENFETPASVYFVLSPLDLIIFRTGVPYSQLEKLESSSDDPQNLSFDIDFDKEKYPGAEKFLRGHSGLSTGSGFIYARYKSDHTRARALNARTCLSLSARALGLSGSIRDFAPTTNADILHGVGQGIWDVACELEKAKIFDPHLELIGGFAASYWKKCPLYDIPDQHFGASAATAIFALMHRMDINILPHLNEESFKTISERCQKLKVEKNDTSILQIWVEALQCLNSVIPIVPKEPDWNTYDQWFLSSYFDNWTGTRIGFLHTSASILAAAFFGKRDEVTGCWDTRHLTSLTTAYSRIGNAVNRSAAGTNIEKVDDSLNRHFFESDIPILCPKHSKKLIPTACHHPILCEISSLKGKDPSHCCARPSHLVLQAKRMNSYHLKLQNLSRKSGIDETSPIDGRRKAIEQLLTPERALELWKKTK